MENKFLLIGIGILLLLAVLFIPKIMSGNAVSKEDIIKIPLSEISGQAKFYDYNGIRYFAVKADDRSVKTAFDACDVCYYSWKGYRQEGDYMVCNNCGNRYPISGLGTENLRGGGCWPGYLPNSVKGDYLIIKEKDLENGRYRFQ